MRESRWVPWKCKTLLEGARTVYEELWTINIQNVRAWTSLAAAKQMLSSLASGECEQ